MRRVVVLVAFGLGVTRGARAEPTDLVARPLVLDAGQVELALTAEVDAQPNELSLAFAPDAWYGVTSRLTVGVIHSDPSVDQVLPDASFCVKSSDYGCGPFYRGSGLDVLYAARLGHLSIAPRVRALVRDVDPVKPAVTLGALVRWQHGRFAVTGDPYLRVGLANFGAGNRTALVLPVSFEVQPTCRWALGVNLGWNSDLAVWRDGWYVPAALDVRVRATSQLDVGATVGFSSAYGPQATVKGRVVFVTAAWSTGGGGPRL